MSAVGGNCSTHCAGHLLEKNAEIVRWKIGRRYFPLKIILIVLIVTKESYKITKRVFALKNVQSIKNVGSENRNDQTFSLAVVGKNRQKHLFCHFSYHQWLNYRPPPRQQRSIDCRQKHLLLLLHFDQNIHFAGWGVASTTTINYFQNGPIPASLCGLFLCYFHTRINFNSALLGIQTQGRRIVGADGSTEL